MASTEQENRATTTEGRRNFRWWITCTLAAAIILFAFSLRYMRIDAGLPYSPHWDESFTADNALRMLTTGDLNPRFFNYPSFLTYLCLAVDFGHYLYLMGQEPTQPEYLNNLGEVKFGIDYKSGVFRKDFSSPSFYRWNRFAVGLLGTLTVVVLMAVAKKAFDARVSLLAGSLLAGMGFHIAQSVKVTTNAPFTFWIAAVILFSVVYGTKQEFRYIVGALVCTGMATGTKYNACLAIIVPLTMYVLYTPRESLFGRRKYRFLLFLAIPPAVFLLCCPYALLDLSTFAAHVGYEIRHYKVRGHGGATSQPGLSHFIYQMSELARNVGWWTYMSACAGISLACFRRPRITAVLMSFPVLYMLLMCSQKANFHRNFLPLYFYAALFAAVFWGSLAEFSSYLTRRKETLARFATPAAALSLLLCVAPFIPDLIRETTLSFKIYHSQDTRTRAVLSINELCSGNNESGPCFVAIAEELYTSKSDLRRLACLYSVVPAASLPGSLHAFDYLVTAQEYENQRLPSRAYFDARHVESVKVLSDDPDTCKPMPRVPRLNAVGPCAVNPTVVILKSKVEPVLGDEMVVNGGFEGDYVRSSFDNIPRGDLPALGGWRITGRDRPPMRATRETSEVFSGEASLRLSRPMDAGGSANLVYPLPDKLEPGSWYRLEFAMKVPTGVGRGPGKIGMSKQGKAQGYEIYNTMAEDGDRIYVPNDPTWRTYTFQFQDKGAATLLWFEWGNFGGGDVFLDEVSLKKVSSDREDAQKPASVSADPAPE